jgi:hypothetical protein
LNALLYRVKTDEELDLFLSGLERFLSQENKLNISLSDLLHVEGEMGCRTRLFATFLKKKIKKRGENGVFGFKENHILLQIIK